MWYISPLFTQSENGQLVNRQTYRLHESLLQLQIPSTTSFAEPKTQSPLLFGQPRVIEAWQGLLSNGHNHLFLAGMPGLSPMAVVRALLSEFPKAHFGVDRDSSIYFMDRIISRIALIGDGNQPGLLFQKSLLIIPVEYILERPAAYWPLKQVLECGGAQLGDNWHELKSQVVILGSASDYDNLNGFDAGFSDRFSLYAECQPEWDIEDNTQIDSWLTAVNQVCQLTSGRSLSIDAAKMMAQYASRLVEHQHKLSLCWEELAKLFRLASQSDSPLTRQEILDLQLRQQKMHNALEKSSHEAILEQTVLVQTEGEAVGQINGLTVVDYCGHSYGEPARITTTVHYGDGEVADVERKSELGGNIHAKGMMILSACLYRLFGRDAPLHLNANIVFEQSYQTIDGDSASLAEYCGLISAIADAPISQELAMTGAVDQFGNVQAIGGINQKIEGFFRVCASRGLTGKQGVILPKANVRQLNLTQEVVDAVANGRFHLYQVTKVEHALELATSIPMADADEDNQYPKDSLYGLVQRRLLQLIGDDDMPLTLWQRVKHRFGLS